MTASQNVALVVNPSETGGLPPGFSLESETYNDILGPVGVNLSSKYLLVAGFLKLALVLPSFNIPIQLEDIKVYLFQTIALQSRANPELKESKVMTIPLWSYRKDSKQQCIGRYTAGQEFSLVQQFRLKDDDIIRSTTSEKSETGIRVSHKLAVVVHYTPLENNPKMETKELKIATDATFTSCCCVVEYLQLPKYTSRPSCDDLDAAFLGLCSSCLVSSSQQADKTGRSRCRLHLLTCLFARCSVVWQSQSRYWRSMVFHKTIFELHNIVSNNKSQHGREMTNTSGT